MGRVEDLERQRVERLAAELVPVLRSDGAARVRPGEVGDVERWRRAARRAARRLGERIATGRTRDGGAWAVLDRPVTDAQRRSSALAFEAALRRGYRPERRP